MHGTAPQRLCGILLLSLCACPNDDAGSEGGDTGESDTGDPGSEVIDPLDGTGAAPPGSPSPQGDSWIAPSSLGNGLVHDTRAAVDASVHVAQLAESVAWSSFVDSNTAMLRRGFRPAQVNAEIAVTDELSIVDNTVYISDDDANYRTEVVTHVFDTLASERAFDEWEPVALGARPTSIDTFYDDGHVGYSVAWVYDSPTNNPAMPWVLKVGQSAAELEALLADPDYRPLSLSSADTRAPPSMRSSSSLPTRPGTGR